tara:strand:+ start:343 stop:636 length:294 start_codon:yes stop_codon:yes gene_type:complete
MENILYKNFYISTGYSFSGKTKHYYIWTEDFADAVAETFRSIKKAKEYINQTMWKTKYFKTENEAHAFMSDNCLYYQMQLIFIENGYGVEYRELKII